jgi:aryl-alcohol dehydrogenase-like predicted oxidoreductase
MYKIDYGYIQASRLGLGSSTFGGSISTNKAKKTLAIALEHGVNYIDTARSYGYGQAESIIGEIVKKQREQVFIATKFGIIAHLPLWKRKLLWLGRLVKKYGLLRKVAMKQVQQQAGTTFSYSIMSLDEVKSSISTSFKELQTDYIDQLIIHSHFDLYLQDTSIVDYLFQLKQSQRIRTIGVAVEGHFTTEQATIVNQNVKQGLIDAAQISFSNRNNSNQLSTKYINYIGIFQGQHPIDAQKLAQIKTQAQAHQNGHLLVTMNTPKHLIENIQLLG